MKPLLALTALCVLPVTVAFSQTCSKQSPDHTVALLELYTSEGCSSCPPADHTVSALQKAAGADLVVPLALHVDYWDDLGWKDRFAQPGFTQRQRWQAGLAGNRSIYTPEMFLGGRELREWANDLSAAIGGINRQPPRAAIRIQAGGVANGRLPVEFHIKAPAGASLFVALYETGLSSHVGAGENHGVVLHHDYVVREWLGPIALDSGAAGGVSVTRTLATPISSLPSHLGVAAFVQNGDGAVLQALALPLCGG